MASSTDDSDDKPTADAKRMGSRSFAGYVTDRMAGRADFSKNPTGGLTGRAKQIDEAERKAVGYRGGGQVSKTPDVEYNKAGGRVAKPYGDEYKMTSPAGRNPHEGFKRGGRAFADGGAVPTDRAGKRFTGFVSDESGDYESYRDKNDKEYLIAPATGRAKGAAGAGRGHTGAMDLDKAKAGSYQSRFGVRAFKSGGMVGANPAPVAKRRGYGKARGA